MKRAVLAIVSTVASLVLLLSFKAHTIAGSPAPPAAVSNSDTASGTADPGGSGAGDGPPSGPSRSGGSRSTAAAKTYTGATAMTRFGPVQVRITVNDQRVTDVTAVTYPTANPRDAQINAYAIPALNAEASSASSARIDMISGATYTSQGYITSLQSALDQAGL